jgi:hypothetical protein
MANTNEKLKRLKEIHQQEEALYTERNEKYGDSFAKTFQEYGEAVALIRLEDKLNRAKTLVSMGLRGSDGESLIDTLMDLSNYANMAIIELTSTTRGDEGQTTEVPKKKRKKKAKEETKEMKEEAPKEKGPLDDLTKKQLIEVISQLGGTVPKKANREKLTEVIAGFPKAKVAVVITSMKPTTETAEGEDGDGKEEEE